MKSVLSPRWRVNEETIAKIQCDKRDKPITKVYSSFTPSTNLVSHQTNVAGEVFADGTIWFHHLFFTQS